MPVLHWFDARNNYSGSIGEFRYMIRPNVAMKTAKEVDFAASTIRAEFWHGPLCYEKSEMEGYAEFPMSQEGRAALKAWLEEHI